MTARKSATGTLLFDEIEKAHPRVLDLFLQILDAARVTLANGETLDLERFLKHRVHVEHRQRRN